MTDRNPGHADGLASVNALVGARIFDGERFHADAALRFAGGRVAGIVRRAEIEPDDRLVELDGGVLTPGFIDAQVNGGGGRLLNDDASAETMRIIAAGHRRYGTTSLLPTLITDRPEMTARAISAATLALAGDDGVAGLHLEGPHLEPRRKGTHLAELMRPVTDADVETFIAARAAIGTLLVTLAAEQVTVAQVARLAAADVVVAIGHSDATADTALALFDAGARGVTHLFNAMSQMGHRAPGLSGAALDHPAVWCGVIADGHHVDPLMLRIALRAKTRRGPGRLFFVTDAMSLVGVAGDSFVLNGRTVYRRAGGYCSSIRLADGTLAGSDLDMAAAIRFGVAELDLPLAEALAMATSYPARFLGLSDRGRLAPGLRADLVHLDGDLQVRATWRSGQRLGS